MEQEARDILKAGLVSKAAPTLNLAELIRQYVDPLGGVELEIPPRDAFAGLPIS